MKPEWCPQEVWEKAMADARAINASIDPIEHVAEAIARALLEAEKRGRRPYEEHLFAILDAQTPADQVQAIRAARTFKTKLGEVQK